MYDLLRGGYPFHRNDLSLEVWHDLGIYKQYLDDQREEQRTLNLMQLLRGK